MHRLLRPIEPMLLNPTITELMWNSHSVAFAEQDGKLIEILSPFGNAEDFEKFVESLTAFSPSRQPRDSFDGILPDGSRFHVTLGSRSPMGPTLTIRKFLRVYNDLDGLVRSGALSEKASVFLKACVRARLNILISGATGAGKTTLLNALAGVTAPAERIITIEDVPEIQLSRKNWVRLVAVREDSKNAARDCLVECLRMRPDRILVGECRSSEALEMLQAMNTGHDGGMTTIHANSSTEALTRLETLILFHAGSEIPLRALRRQIVDAIDLVIHVEREPDGQRQVSDILELVGMEGEVITRSSIFKRSESFGKRLLRATGLVPSFMPRLTKGAVSLPTNFFDSGAFELVSRRA